ncbi:MAG: hypothetical protein ACI9XZ_004260 [Alphaproteobacteria bacterium]|jgi:hypothetical protein
MLRLFTQAGSCLDDARIARRIWRVACGRVQVMSPACLRGFMTAGPDVIRRSGPNHLLGLDTLDPETGFPDLQVDRFASLHLHPRNSKLLVNSFVRPRRAILPSRPPTQHATERRRCQDRPSLGRRRLGLYSVEHGSRIDTNGDHCFLLHFSTSWLAPNHKRTVRTRGR